MPNWSLPQNRPMAAEAKKLLTLTTAWSVNPQMVVEAIVFVRPTDSSRAAPRVIGSVKPGSMVAALAMELRTLPHAFLHHQGWERDDQQPKVFDKAHSLGVA